MNRTQISDSLLAAVLTAFCSGVCAGDPLTSQATHLPGTQPLDPADAGIGDWDGFIQRKLDSSVTARQKTFRPDVTSASRFEESLQSHRDRLGHLTGVRDPRSPATPFELVATTEQPALVGEGAGFQAFAVRWSAFGDVHGEGLLLVPVGRAPVAHVVAIPDASQTPEQISGLAPGVEPESQFARRLAESGCQVIVPTLINREIKIHGREGWRAYARQPMSNREFLFRPAFELGRHLIGYEIQKVLAAVDRFKNADPAGRVGVIGWGDGGLLALYAGALDRRIDATCVSGYFNSRQKIWQEPFDREVFGLLTEFGDAEIAGLVAPRPFIVEACRAPVGNVVSPGGSTGNLLQPKREDVRLEVERACQLANGLQPPSVIQLVESGDGTGPYGSSRALQDFMAAFTEKPALATGGPSPRRLGLPVDSAARHERQFHEIDRHNQWLLQESPYLRDEFMSKLDTTSLAKHQATVGWYRDYFRNEINGLFDDPPLPPRARTRRIRETDLWTAYEVRLDVFEGTGAAGYLLIPKGILDGDGEKRPVVVCQHGGGGSPDQVMFDAGGAYHAFGSKLAEQGFITFAPSIPFPPSDATMRKCRAIKKTQYSYIAAMHQQALRWLQELPYVDGERIGLYGLSWGGKTAMRMPILVDGYCLSIASGDFNDWIWKNATNRSDYSYVFQPEPYIFEFDLGSTFSYAEMAALIAPRPFMVERGHMDPVGTDERVGSEYAKVLHLYAARLGIPERCAIEWFVGGHEINGRGTFEFLHRHLDRSKH